MERIPRRMEKVYSTERFNQGIQPNGYIADIDWEFREIIVHFYRNDRPKEMDVESYEFDQIDGCWTRDYGGLWWL